jgi:uncharacterized protein YbjT (DUF2867 family)
MSLFILVLGATGRFRPVAQLLIDRGHRVRAGTRNPSSPAARQLAALGAELVACDFEDRASLEAAAHGIDAVFASGTAHQAGPGGEIRHGRNLADALSTVALSQLVYISGAGADRRTNVPVFESKREVERYLNERRVPSTILAPVYLMENLFNPWNVSVLEAGFFPTFLPESRSVQQVPVIDIAAFAVHTFEHPDDFLGERIELASDLVTAVDAARFVSAVVGRELKVRELAPSGGLHVLFEWLDRVGFDVDIAALQRHHPQVHWHTFGEWAADQQWNSLSRAARVQQLEGCARR